MLFHQQLLTQQALFVEPDFRFSFPSILRHPPQKGGLLFLLLIILALDFAIVFSFLRETSLRIGSRDPHPRFER